MHSISIQSKQTQFITMMRKEYFVQNASTTQLLAFNF
jgi:hypothetical protein